ncbi:MAG TPA: DNA repair protein RecO [Firmicutes bacterium]|nr:DNA repair protein RecO [Candidatus Fermentithermobacillaceae bacterium]
MSLYQTEGIVLSQTPLGENDKIITLLSPEEGLVRAVVKGARKPKSRLSAVTQPFTRASFQLSRGKSLDRVIQVSLKTSHPGILSDYAKVVCASYVSELVAELSPEKQQNREQFWFFSSVLDHLEQREDPWVVVKWTEVGLLLRAGLLPSFDECALCGGEIVQPAYFSAEAGGAVCGKCGQAKDAADWAGVQAGNLALGEQTVRAIPVSPGTLKTLEILRDSGNQCPNLTAKGQVRQEVNDVLQQCVDHALGKRLKSSLLVGSILVSPHRE